MKGALQNGMSLFQDLKLKRRKVDSRCSSDGESIGTSESTASLSPEAQSHSEGSPKEKERCITPEEFAPPLTSKGSYSPQLFFMVKPDNNGRNKLPYENFVVNSDCHKQSSVIKLSSVSEESASVKSEPDEEIHDSPEDISESGAGENGASRIDAKAQNDQSINNTNNNRDGDMSDTENGSARESNNCNENGGAIKRERNDEAEQDCRGGGHVMNGSSKRSSPQPQSRASSCSPNGLPESASTLIITKQHKESGQMNGMREDSLLSQQQVNHHHNHQRIHHSLIPTQNHLHARLTGGGGGGGGNNEVSCRPLNTLPGLIQVDGRNLAAEKADPISVVTSTSLSFQPHSMYRINGVRPEVISGGAVTPTATSNTNRSLNGSNSNSPGSVQSRKSPTLSRSPNSSPANSSSSGSIVSGGSLHSPGAPLVAGGALGLVNSSIGSSSNHHHNGNNNNNNHHHVNLNRTPTVIMGEAGGVRTMLWSQPGQVLPPQVDVNNGGAPTTTNGHGPATNGYPPSNQMTPSNTYNNISNNSNSNNNNTSSPPHHLQKGALSMERLWASEALNLSTTPNAISNGTNGHPSNTVGNNSDGLGITSLSHNIHNSNGNGSMNPDDEDYEQPMICMICEDRATGLHYGIITCEGCKGFFKRTVQNRRVYTCVADGTCEITKAQRNRCQYCRFKKCIEQGMVLQAVREDRMPGGRNSGAVYNLYKVPVKYRKHKKGNRVNGAGGKAEKIQPPPQQSPIPSIQTGKILKAALTSPNEVTHLRQPMPFETAAAMITNLVQCDNFHDIAALQNWDELLEARGDLSEKLCQMGDSIVYRLVQWTKRLPFYQEVPVDVHTRVLTHKWHELLVLTTSAWQAMHTPGPSPNLTAEEETTESLQVLQRCLQAMMGRSLTVEQLRQDVGQMVERLTHLTRAFRRLSIRIEEYVCLKVITMLQNTGTRSPEVGVIQERYIKCLRTFLEVTCPGHPNRLSDLLRTLPEVQMAAALLLESKMFYVPFLLNSALLQR